MNPRYDIPHETWERLSALQDGDLPADEAASLAAAHPEAVRRLAAQRAALQAPIQAPAGFADRVFAAVEHEPIPANRPWWKRAEMAVFAAAAAAVVVFAIPWPEPSDTSAPARVAPLPRPQAAPTPTQEALPPVAPAAVPKRAPRPTPPKGEAEAPVEAAPPLPAPEPVGTADPEPAWSRQHGYRAAEPAVVARLPQAAARLGAHLEDDQGNPISAAQLEGFQGAVFLTIPADRLPELDAELKRIGAVRAHRDAEQLHGDTLEVQINVDLR